MQTCADGLNRAHRIHRQQQIYALRGGSLSLTQMRMPQGLRSKAPADDVLEQPGLPVHDQDGCQRR